MISVIVPVYNVRPYLEKCVRSVLSQTYGDFELLLVDDGSTDGSGELCDRLSREDKRIRVFHQANAGVSVARNAGLRAAKGDWATFVDADDYILPECLERLFDAAVREKAQIAVCSSILKEDDSETVQNVLPGGGSAIEVSCVMPGGGFAKEMPSVMPGDDSAKEVSNAMPGGGFAKEVSNAMPGGGPAKEVSSGKPVVLSGRGPCRASWDVRGGPYRVPAWVCGKLFFLPAFRGIRFCRKLSYGEDLAFLMECYDRDVRMALLSYPGYVYVQRKDSCTHSFERKWRRFASAVKADAYLYRHLSLDKVTGENGYIRDFGLHLYTLLSLLIREGDKEAYVREGKRLRRYCRALEMDRYVAAKHRFLFAFYRRFPKVYWKILRTVFACTGKLYSEAGEGEQDAAPPRDPGTLTDRDAAPLRDSGTAGDRDAAPLRDSGAAGDRDTAPLRDSGAAWGRGFSPLSDPCAAKGKDTPLAEGLVSVIIPVYRVEPYLDKCVSSVLGQTYQNIEVILVDDGSPDGCPALCDKWAKKDGRVRVLHKKNGGLSSARNAGLDVARGEYLLFVDSDDSIEACCIERLFAALIEADADVACGRYREEYLPGEGETPPVRGEMPFKKGRASGAGEAPSEGETFSKTRRVVDELGFWQTYYADMLNPKKSHQRAISLMVSWCKLYRREVFDTLRFDEGKLLEDEFLVHAIVGRCRRLALLDEPLYRYLQRERSLVRTDLALREAAYEEALSRRLTYFLSQKRLAPLVPPTVHLGLENQVVAYFRLKWEEGDMKAARAVWRAYRIWFRKYGRFLLGQGVSAALFCRYHFFYLGEYPVRAYNKIRRGWRRPDRSP